MIRAVLIIGLVFFVCLVLCVTKCGSKYDK